MDLRAEKRTARDADRARRRRGVELEDAILDAAWEALMVGGYNGFTYEAVAERARTSKPVLYRRWPTRRDLLLATFRHHGAQTRLELPDTGSLRGDVLEVLRSSNERRGREFAVLAEASLGSFYSKDGITPADLRAALVGEGPTMLERVIARATERGELAASIPPSIARLPFDLFRNDAIMSLGPVPEARLVEIVDEIFLPLVRARSARS